MNTLFVPPTGLRNLQTLVELGVDKNTTVVFPARLMTTIAELGTFPAREKTAAGIPAPLITANGAANHDEVSPA